ncbi:hypothetical protein GCM10027321_04700 [Massilia terrae]
MAAGPLLAGCKLGLLAAAVSGVLPPLQAASTPANKAGKTKSCFRFIRLSFKKNTD